MSHGRGGSGKSVTYYFNGPYLVVVVVKVVMMNDTYYRDDPHDLSPTICHDP
jgi:hypothetical protein